MFKSTNNSKQKLVKQSTSLTNRMLPVPVKLHVLLVYHISLCHDVTTILNHVLSFIGFSLWFFTCVLQSLFGLALYVFNIL